MNFAADTGTAYNAQLGDTVSIKGDGKNLSTSVDKGTITVHMSDTPVFTSVTASTITGNTIKAGDTVTLSHQGADMGGTKITHLKDGDISPTSTDAVNGSQLYSTENRINLLDRQVNHLDSQINRVGAGAAALAFDPDDKWDFAAGYGNYKNANAVAIGAYYRPNEDVMFNVGGSFSGGENMVNAGISFSLDRTARVSNSRTAMAKEIVDLRANVANLTALVGQLTAGMGGTIEMDRMKLFPDVPENHWAYEYIGRLAAAGIVEGYPDGMFNGNRMMSRYEFAAMLYRALEKGVKLDHKLVREFEPEMGRIHVARISGADGDRGKIERVRVYGGDNRDHYGSKLK